MSKAARDGVVVTVVVTGRRLGVFDDSQRGARARQKGLQRSASTSAAREYQPTDLVVVDGIDWSRTDSDIITTGGRLRVWPDWTPADHALSARRFAYSLPIE